MSAPKPAGQAAHTPGPWSLEDVGWASDLSIAAPNGETVAVVCNAKEGSEFFCAEQVENGELLAAAPELLAALRAMLNLYARTGDHVHKGYAPNSDCIACQARAVLAKVGGAE